MEKPIKIDYCFRFDNGELKTFNILIDRVTLNLISDKNPEPPEWTVLERNKCSICSLDGRSKKYCPIALNLSAITDEFQDFFSYQNVNVTVNTYERTYSKETNIQEGLGGLIGVIMVTSECPVMEYIKPMVRFHLPFANLLETVYRMSSMYLLSQYFLKMDGEPAGFDLKGLKEIYEKISSVNRDFSQRISEAAKKDASANALVNLDCFANMIIDADRVLQDIKLDYSIYFS
ncbi:MAG: hypothetical protein A2X59_00315 [Nitrospirae bacterium GWC2_42_7]|nr:MAG: hypothetical protein A2X59_00315 [Nitrospirae bacterium GWC2_42_7]